MIVQYLLIAICTILSISFFCGKGRWLIAGYNTMNDNDKQKYDYKKLCYVMGCCLAVIDVLLIISCIIGEATTDKWKNLFSVIGIVDAILTVILANTICRKK